MSLTKTNNEFMGEMSDLVDSVVPEGFSEEKRQMFIQSFIRACVRDGVAFMSQEEEVSND